LKNKNNKSLKLNNAKFQSLKNSPRLSPLWQLLIFILAVGVIYFVLFETVYTTPYSGTALFLKYASQIMDGQVPYRDFSVEYPPLALLFFVLPRLLSGVFEYYLLLFKIEVLLAVLIGLYLMYRLALRLGKAPWKIMLVYTLCILAVGPIIAEQFDIFAAILTAGSLYALICGKNKSAWVLLALGALTKVYPVFLAPMYLLISLHNRQYRAAAKGILTFIIIGAIFTLPFFIIGLDSIRGLVEYHLQRGIQMESIFSTFLLAADKLGLTYVETTYDFGSWNIAGVAADKLTGISGLIMAAALILVYWFIYKRIKPGKSQSTRTGAYALLIICTVLITGKVLSPQYLIWLVPIIPMVLFRGRLVIAAIFICIGAVTYYLFPHAYLDLIALRNAPVVALFFRNLLIIALALLAAIYLKRMKSSE
jgi:hypothetical protein